MISGLVYVIWFIELSGWIVPFIPFSGLSYVLPVSHVGSIHVRWTHFLYFYLLFCHTLVRNHFLLCFFHRKTFLIIFWVKALIVLKSLLLPFLRRPGWFRVRWPCQISARKVLWKFSGFVESFHSSTRKIWIQVASSCRHWRTFSSFCKHFAEKFILQRLH